MHAVDGVSLHIVEGEVLGLVGESGCGKSTLGRMIAGILPPTSGTAMLAGVAVMGHGRRPVKTTTRVQMVFQDPFASLDPRMRIGEIIAEGPLAHGIVDRAGARGYVAGMACRRSGSIQHSRRAIRTSFPAVSASASPSRARSP